MTRGHKEPYTVSPSTLAVLYNLGFKSCRRCKNPIEVGDEVKRTLFYIYHKRCLKYL